MNKMHVERICGWMAMIAAGLLLSGCEPNVDYRVLDIGHLGPPYCLVRDSTGGQSNLAPTTVPTIALKRPDDWVTLKDITLTAAVHTGKCPETATVEGNKLTIETGDDGGFAVSMVHAEDGTTMTRSFRYPVGDTVHADSYLVATKKQCEEGAPGCGKFDHYDAYLYVVDTRQDAASRGVPKFVMLDLFERVDPSEACRLERPEHAVKSRNTSTNSVDCVPPWRDAMTQVDGSAPIDLIAPLDVVLRFVQTGSGGGYEPPN